MNYPKTSPTAYFRLAFFLFLAFSFVSNVHASKNLYTPNEEDSVYAVVGKMPEFPGGEKALIEFLNSNIQYPPDAQKKNEQGRVIVRFVVGKTGKVEQATVIKSVSPALDKEALRVIGLLPDWTPGEQNGVAVPVYKILPIVFQNLSEEERWQANANTVVVIDSVQMPAGFNIGILNSGKLESLQVLKPFPKEEKARLMKKYGKQAADGVILITTKKHEIQYTLADSIPGCTDAATVPQFPGGIAGLTKFMADSLQYPFVAQRLKTQGKVFVQFNVERNGKISDARVIRSVDYFLDREALRLLAAMPHWNPGTKCGEKVSIRVIMPVIFKLDLPAAEKEWERTEKTIIMLDGKRLPSTFNLEWIDYSGLSAYKVLQPTTKEITKKLVSEYGKDAVNGVIVMESVK